MSRSDLTPRELEIAHLIVRGLEYDEMAALLDVSIHTVNAHVKSIRWKLGARNGRHVAVLCAERLRGADPDPPTETS